MPRMKHLQTTAHFVQNSEYRSYWPGPGFAFAFFIWKWFSTAHSLD